MAKSKQQELEEVEKQIQELEEKRDNLKAEAEEEKLEELKKNTTLGSTAVWKEKGEEKKAEIDKISRKSVSVLVDEKLKSIQWNKLVRIE